MHWLAGYLALRCRRRLLSQRRLPLISFSMSLPHFGAEHGKHGVSPAWKWVHIIDAFGAIGLGVWAIASHHYAMFAGGFAAVSPDFVWVQRYFAERHST